MAFMLDNVVLYKPENRIVTVNGIGERYVQLFSEMPFSDNSQYKSVLRNEIGLLEIVDNDLLRLGYTRTGNGFIHKAMQPTCNENGTMFHLIHNKTDKGYFFYGVQTINVPFPKYIHELQNMVQVLIKYKLIYNFDNE